VCGGATNIWPTELLFDCTGTPYLANGWRRFCQRHDIVVGHLIIFNFDGDHQIMVLLRRRPVAMGYLILLLFILGYNLICNVYNVLNPIQCNAIYFISTDCKLAPC
jgi:hypothetical protein